MGDNSLLDFNLIKLVAVEAVGKSLGKVLLVGFEGVKILAFSDLELCDPLVLLDEHGWVMDECTFLGGFLCVFGGFVALSDFQELLEFGDFSWLSKRQLTIGGLNIIRINITIFAIYYI